MYHGIVRRASGCSNHHQYHPTWIFSYNMIVECHIIYVQEGHITRCRCSKTWIQSCASFLCAYFVSLIANCRQRNEQRDRGKGNRV